MLIVASGRTQLLLPLSTVGISPTISMLPVLLDTDTCNTSAAIEVGTEQQIALSELQH